jgi:hypothetical protein
MGTGTFIMKPGDKITISAIYDGQMHGEIKFRTTIGTGICAQGDVVTDQDKALQDAAHTGIGVTLGEKHVPLNEFYASTDARMREALQAADDLVSLHRDYSTMPYPEFQAKHGPCDSTKLFSEIRRRYVEARQALASAPRLALRGARLVSDDGKRWRIEHPDWVMQPVGRVSCEQAKAICEAALTPASVQGNSSDGGSTDAQLIDSTTAKTYVHVPPGAEWIKGPFNPGNGNAGTTFASDPAPQGQDAARWNLSNQYIVDGMVVGEVRQHGEFGEWWSAHRTNHDFSRAMIETGYEEKADAMQAVVDAVLTSMDPAAPQGQDELPELPDDDADFTPDLARKIIAKYQEIIRTRAPDATEAVVFWYQNYEGKEGYRRAVPISMRFGTSEWHKKPQWLLLAFDEDKKANREFAVADMRDVIGQQILHFAAPPAKPTDLALDPATVERCAQVAENFEVTLDEDDPFGNRQIAAGIRALIYGGGK